jgi:hypothetical protein
MVKNLPFFNTSLHKPHNILDEDTWMVRNVCDTPNLHIVNIYIVGFDNKILDGKRSNL